MLLLAFVLLTMTPLFYIPIDEFALKWRFAEDSTKWTVLPPSDLAFLKPLTDNSAEQLWTKYVDDSAKHLMEIVLKTDPPDRDLFGKRVLEIDDDWSSREEHRRVSAALRNQLDIADSATLFFFWNASCAVETTWDILLRYWSDFCYPSDDSNVATMLDAGVNLYYIEGTVWQGPTNNVNHAT